MPRQPDFFEQLTAEVLGALESFAREPGVTVDDCVDWLGSRKIDASRSAVARWKKRFDAEDKFRASNEVARGLVEAAKNQGTVAISDAATLQLSQMLFEQLLKIQAAGEVSTKELFGASMALKNVIAAKGHVDELREKFDQEMRKLEGTARTADQIFTPERVAEARKRIFGV